MATVTPAGREQGKRLKALRERTGVAKGHLMDALTFSTTQTYDLYERGVSVIRLDRVSAWATAFGMSDADFLAYVLNGDDYDPDWDFLAALRDVRPDDPDYTDRTYIEHQDASQDVQRAIVETLRELTEYERETQRERRTSPEPRSGRAVAENRAHYAG